MVLQLRKITRRSPELPEALRLYESAFPANERWGIERVLDDATGISEMFGFYEAGALAGFAILLNWGDMAHIIYFAVEENMRGRGVGSEALRLIRALKPGRRLLVDIERHRPDAGQQRPAPPPQGLLRAQRLRRSRRILQLARAKTTRL